MRYSMMLKLSMIIGLIGVIPMLSHAGSFDPMIMGAKSVAMGGAGVAMSTDAYAVHHNPAGLVGIRRPELVMSHMDLQGLGLLVNDHLTYAQPFVFNNVVAVSWVRLGTTGKVRFLNYSENTFVLSYQQPIIENLSTGVNVKIFEVQYDQTAGGFGVDVGARYRVLPEIAVGVVAENVNRPEIYWQTGAYDRLPINFKVGLAGYIDADTAVALDGHNLLEAYPEIRLGVERWFFDDLLVVRAGSFYSTHDQKIMPSGGLGIKISFIEFDYAYGSHYDLNGSHVLSLKIAF